MTVWWLLSFFWIKTCPVWCEAYNCSNSSKNNPEKTLYTLSKNDAPEKHGNCFKPKREDFCAK